MKLKDNAVNIWGLKKEMRPVLHNAEKIWKNHGQELVVTCARNGMHSAGSLHYFGLAIDLRTNYFKNLAETKQVAYELSNVLGSNYDVIIEDTHIHVEYDTLWKY